MLGFNVGLADNATRTAMKELERPCEPRHIIYRLEEAW